MTMLSEVRLAFCSAGEVFGGVERHLLGLCESLRNKGKEPLLVLFNDEELAHRARQDHLQPIVVPARHRYDPRQASQLAEVFSSNRVNVVHVHGYKATVLSALARRKRQQFAIVKTVHGRPEPGMGNPLASIKTHLFYALDHLAARNARATVCFVSKDIRDHFREQYRGLKHHVIYNGIEPLSPEHTRRPPELDEHFFNIGIVGRLTPVKGVAHAIEAIQGNSMPTNLRLNILGTGPQLTRLERQAGNSPAAEKVRFLGFRRNIYDYIAHFDALLMPSLHEGLPYTLLEAMSLGTPILASRVGGLAEILEHDRSALLFPPGDPGAIREAIHQLVTDPTHAGRLGQAAGALQRENFTLSRLSADYWRVYEEVLAKSNEALS